MRILSSGLLIAVLGLAACGGPPAELLAFTPGEARQLPAIRLAPGASTLCALTPYKAQVTGRDAAAFNAFIARRPIQMSDEASWMLLWKDGSGLHDRRVPRFPVDLVNDDRTAPPPPGLRLVDCAAADRSVLAKLPRTDRTRIVFAERAAP